MKTTAEERGKAFSIQEQLPVHVHCPELKSPKSCIREWEKPIMPVELRWHLENCRNEPGRVVRVLIVTRGSGLSRKIGGFVYFLRRSCLSSPKARCRMGLAVETLIVPATFAELSRLKTCSAGPRLTPLSAHTSHAVPAGNRSHVIPRRVTDLEGNIVRHSHFDGESTTSSESSLQDVDPGPDRRTERAPTRNCRASLRASCGMAASG